MKDGTSDVGGQKRGRDGEQCLRNAEGKKTEKRRKKKGKKQRAEHERGTHGEENQYSALKRGLHQRYNYAKCVVFMCQKATDIL